MDSLENKSVDSTSSNEQNTAVPVAPTPPAPGFGKYVPLVGGYFFAFILGVATCSVVSQCSHEDSNAKVNPAWDPKDTGNGVALDAGSAGSGGSSGAGGAAASSAGSAGTGGTAGSSGSGGMAGSAGMSAMPLASTSSSAVPVPVTSATVKHKTKPVSSAKSASSN